MSSPLQPSHDDALRDILARLLDWEEAHATFDAAAHGLPTKLRGVRVEGFPHSAWELVEHIRIAQRDILAFSSAAEYHHPAWPDDYWPASAAPPTAEAWDASLAAVRADREALKRLAADRSRDLFVPVPNGEGEQTLIRALLLVADHTAYHVGQLVAVRRLLGAWSA